MLSEMFNKRKQALNLLAAAETASKAFVAENRNLARASTSSSSTSSTDDMNTRAEYERAIKKLEEFRNKKLSDPKKAIDIRAQIDVAITKHKQIFFEPNVDPKPTLQSLLATVDNKDSAYKQALTKEIYGNKTVYQTETGQLEAQIRQLNALPTRDARRKELPKLLNEYGIAKANFLVATLSVANSEGMQKLIDSSRNKLTRIQEDDPVRAKLIEAEIQGLKQLKKGVEYNEEYLAENKTQMRDLGVEVAGKMKFQDMGRRDLDHFQEDPLKFIKDHLPAAEGYQVTEIKKPGGGNNFLFKVEKDGVSVVVKFSPYPNDLHVKKMDYPNIQDRITNPENFSEIYAMKTIPGTTDFDAFTMEVSEYMTAVSLPKYYMDFEPEGHDPDQLASLRQRAVLEEGKRFAESDAKERAAGVIQADRKPSNVFRVADGDEVRHVTSDKKGAIVLRNPEDFTDNVVPSTYSTAACLVAPNNPKNRQLDPDAVRSETLAFSLMEMMTISEDNPDCHNLGTLLRTYDSKKDPETHFKAFWNDPVFQNGYGPAVKDLCLDLIKHKIAPDQVLGRVNDVLQSLNADPRYQAQSDSESSEASTSQANEAYQQRATEIRNNIAPAPAATRTTNDDDDNPDEDASYKTPPPSPRS